MTLLRSIPELTAISEPIVLAFGMFDGVHSGHQAVLDAAKTAAQMHAGVPVIFTFDPHPARVLRPEAAPKLLCSAPHELLILQRFGIETVLICPFTPTVAAIPAEEFMRQIHAACGKLAAICVGESWRFGQGRSGDLALLRALPELAGVEIIGVPEHQVDGETVSSTRIRRAVEGGDLVQAGRLLGREYSVYGEVIHGNGLARGMGFPTANLRVDNEQLPPSGVYAVRVRLPKQHAKGVANLGRRPTLELEIQSLNLEVHIFEYSEDLYGQFLEVEFIQKLREERKFDGLDALKAQIALDCEAAKAALA